MSIDPIDQVRGMDIDHQPSFSVYVDESGDEGWTFRTASGEKGSSTWLVLSAAVFRNDTEAQVVKCVDSIKDKLKKPMNKPLHFRDLDHEGKILCARAIGRSQLKAVTVAMYKPALVGLTFQKKRFLYHYASKLLLERVSNLCTLRMADTTRPLLPGNGTASVVFAHRRVYSQASFDEYLDKLKYNPESNCSINWSVIDTSRIKSAEPYTFKGLQVADTIASAVFSAIEPSPNGITEARYVSELENCFWADSERGVYSYGFKPFPSEGVTHLRTSTWFVIRKMAGSRSQMPPQP